jgi:ribosomal protein S27AE
MNIFCKNCDKQMARNGNHFICDKCHIVVKVRFSCDECIKLGLNVNDW